MDIKYRFYPYPVLWDRTDDYNNSSFDCKVDLQRDIRSFVLNISFELNNKKLEEMIKKEEAEYVLHIESPESAYRLTSNTKEKEKKIKLEDEHLLGRVSLCSFIVAKRDLYEYSNDDFDEAYEGTSFNLDKGTILAIGTQQTFYVEKESDDLSKIESIFRIYKKETVEEMPLEVELNDEKIRLGLNITAYESYYMNIQNKQDIINAFLIFPALVFAFERIKESFAEYSGYRWFRAIAAMLKKYGKELDEDFVNAKTSLELAQDIMNMPVAKALYEIGIRNEED